MEVVSTSNLVALETEKTTTACNFQTMARNFCYVTWFDERSNRKLCKREIFDLQFHDGRIVKKHPKKHIYTKQQNQNWPAIS